MKKIFKYLLFLIGTLLLIGIGAFLYIQISGIPSYKAEKIDYKVEVTPERVARGKKLAILLCANCHKNHETGALTGHLMSDAPEEFGVIYSQNITQDKEYGIGDWTDGELLFLLRTGIKRNGKYSPPWMAKLPNMADEDINSVIAFLRSNDPMVAPAAVEDKPCEPSFLTKFLTHVAFKPFAMPDHKIEMPDTANPVALGKYLTINLECFSCHSADFKSNNYLNPEQSVGYLGGGNKPLNNEGKVMVTQNLTPDDETGIGKWSEERFVNALRTGIMEDGHPLRYPMVPYANLTDQEAKAIYAYLRTVPPIKNLVPRSAF